MNGQARHDATSNRPGSELFAGLTAVVISFAVSGLISYLNTRMLNQDAHQVTNTHELLSALDGVLSIMKDAETGQRGYLITGDDRYLAPHTEAVARIDEQLGRVERLIHDKPEQQSRISAVKNQIGIKLRELNETIALRRTQGFEVARKKVESDVGKAAMDAVRAQVGVMQADERERHTVRLAEMNSAYRVAVGSGVLTSILGVLLSAGVAYLVHRGVITRRRQEWLQSGQIGINEALAGDQRLEQLGESVLRFLAKYLDAHAGAFFVRNGRGFRRIATYGVAAINGVPEGFEPGDGLLGQAAQDKRAFLIREVPEGYMSIGSALGKGKPRHLVVAPSIADGVVNGVLEVGFIHPLEELTVQLLNQVSESLGVAVQSATYRTHLQDLIEETQRQAEELQSQGEELRVSNEVLEEQGRALKESQTHLEQQQTELEQTNLQLQQHTNLLGLQRDELARAKEALQLQTRDLAQASRYKSDFLANMSHELRTPLNSSLILAKLLADNPHGNLSEDQVKYAETIRSAGNDLLVLINDVLDLSKIEAGRTEIRSEHVRVAGMVEELSRGFEPVAAQKGLAFRTRIPPDCPQTIETDRQRLEQILKNLLSNAIKFTESGEVVLKVGHGGEGLISFAVEDTGIGIAEHERQVIFEAFRQADGTTNRKYGGTGLGLSISRELVRLLGGDIRLESQPGRGSTFTVTIPEVYQPRVLQPIAKPPSLDSRPSEVAARPAPTLAKPPGTGTQILTRRVEDDRERLTGDRNVILVVEDDEPFARVLYDLAHELDFQCLIATTAEEGQTMAVQYLPSAVVLDIGLPDHSGLSVLDRLKHDARTRHIPVHVVSAGDYSEAALCARRGGIHAQAGQTGGAGAGAETTRDTARPEDAPCPGG